MTAPLAAGLYAACSGAATAPGHPRLRPGIHRLDADGAEVVAEGDGLSDPAYLIRHPRAARAYSLGRSGAPDQTDGLVGWWSVTGHGRWAPVGSRPSAGTGPSHLAVSREGGVLVVANYTDGVVATFALDADGDVGPLLDRASQHGSGPVRDRQQSSHPHMVAISPATGEVLVPDLGADKVFVYDLDEATGRLQGGDHTSVSLPAGSGPRHLAFFPDGEAAVTNELGNTVALLRRARHGYEVADIVKATPPDDRDANSPSAIRVSTTGLVHVANRGHDTVATFHRPERGHLALVAAVACGGHWPRDLVLDEEAGAMYVANHRSDGVAALGLGPSGLPSTVERHWSVPRPTCVALIRPAGSRS